MTLHIRPYDAKQDQAALVEIWHAASRLAHAFLGEDRLAQQREQVATVWLAEAETHVAVVDHRPVGFISLLGHEVGGLFVDPAHQGQGIGRCLLDRAQADHPVLELDVYLDNAKARAFYASVGFTQLGQSPTDREGLPFGLAHLRRQARG